jgi:hypothetical protein
MSSAAEWLAWCQSGNRGAWEIAQLLPGRGHRPRDFVQRVSASARQYRRFFRHGEQIF